MSPSAQVLFRASPEAKSLAARRAAESGVSLSRALAALLLAYGSGEIEVRVVAARPGRPKSVRPAPRKAKPVRPSAKRRKLTTKT